MVVRRSTLADQVSEEIIRLIDETGLKDGDEIPPEGELATRFGVNRLAVREAIRTLSAREILVSSQGKPARVSVPTAKVFGQILQFRLGQDSLRFEDVLDARRAIENAVVRRAAQRSADGRADLSEAARLLEEMTGVVNDPERFVALDVAFHAEIAHIAANGMLKLVLDSLGELLTEHRMASYQGRSRRGATHETTINAHRAILDAIGAGDVGAAAQAMEAHLSETGKDLAGKSK